MIKNIFFFVEPTLASVTTSIGFIIGSIADYSTSDIIGRNSGVSFEIIIPIAGVIFWLGRWMSKMDGEIKSIRKHLTRQDEAIEKVINKQ